MAQGAFEQLRAETGRQMCERVLASGLGDADGVYTYDVMGLEVLRAARADGRWTVMEQTIVPPPIIYKELREEQARFPKWEAPIHEEDFVGSVGDRTRREWDEADVILCGSEYVKRGVVECGGDPGRCRVVPYGIDGALAAPPRTRADRPPRVLTVGTVGLRKGTPWVLEAARRFPEAEFRVVGPAGSVSDAAQRDLQAHLDFVGAVPRAAILKHFLWADLFLFPSLAEGSAAVCYEAHACGLPVVTTPNAGSMVRDSVDGYVVAPRDADALVAALRAAWSSDDHYAALSRAAVARAEAGSLDAYAHRLIDAIHALPSTDAE